LKATRMPSMWKTKAARCALPVPSIMYTPAPQAARYHMTNG
jgi:hypothetical protein